MLFAMTKVAFTVRGHSAALARSSVLMEVSAVARLDGSEKDA